MKYLVREGVSWPYTSFDYAIEPITMDSVIRCPECKDVAVLKDWQESEVECGSCGAHTAIRCPKCYSSIDHVWAKPFEVVSTQEAPNDGV